MARGVTNILKRTGRTVVATALVVVMMLFTGLISIHVIADIHDPVTGSSVVTDRADGSMPTTADQDTSDLAVDTFG
ncbi:MAG: hypothetical protein GWN39_17950, partial [Thermoplasmata archaeon]|nr:hypothetical protein [Thermoplasmata archaeon]NIS13993.1 hypothetical protein [Thermoplasmata archaeon]NIS21825.1 hypothetical protein [Thermoplasmata archaeon]NIT79430.1 hypothetical protein [Thermoplasmata archaeon]NIU50862.1 hypothetical protein [Thermoplasmata archaeon]